MLEYTADRRISINNQDVALPALQTRLREIFETRRDKTMFIAGAGTLTYGEIIDVIDAREGSRVDKVGNRHRGDAPGRGRGARRLES